MHSPQEKALPVARPQEDITPVASHQEDLGVMTIFEEDTLEDLLRTEEAMGEKKGQFSCDTINVAKVAFSKKSFLVDFLQIY